MIKKLLIIVSGFIILFFIDAGIVFPSSRLSLENREPNKIIHQHVVLPCDTHRAFQMFTVYNNVEQWLTVVADIEPVVGGKYECFWNPEDREYNSTIGCKVTAIEENKLIAFEWRGPVQFKLFMNNTDPLTHVVVVFLPVGTDVNFRTEIHLIHSGWRSTEEWEEARLFFERAWQLSFERLEKIINED